MISLSNYGEEEKARRDLIKDTSGAIIVACKEKPTKSVSASPTRTIQVKAVLKKIINSN